MTSQPPSDKSDTNKTYAEAQEEKKSGSYGAIETFTGRMFSPLLNPDARDIDIVDIAHSLSMNCRYNGHCKQFYSVAEHCVLMSQSDFIKVKFVSDHVVNTYRKWALLHDASEAYLPDMRRPIKSIVDEFDEAEERLHEVIADRFGLSYPIPSIVHRMDNMILQDEASQLMHSAGDREFWVFPEGSKLDVEIQNWRPHRAKREYIEQYDKLFGTETSYTVAGGM